MKSNIIKAMLLGALTLGAMPPAIAQKQVPATQLGVLVYGKSDIKLDDNEAVEMEIQTYTRYKYALTDCSWITPKIVDGKLSLSIDENPSGSVRNTMLTLRTAQGVNTIINVQQPGWNMAGQAQAAVDNQYAIPVRAVDASKNSAGRAEPGNEIEKSYDGDIYTLYHSSFGGFDPENEAEWPVLEYYFTEQGAEAGAGVDLESILYYPRVEGGENGRFGIITVEIGTYKSANELNWAHVSNDTIDFGISDQVSTVVIPDKLQKGIYGVRFTVHTGGTVRGDHRNYASVAEMKFRKLNASNLDDKDKSLFADAVCSKLKPGTTQAQIDAMSSPFYKELAQKLFDGSYDASHMVSTHNAVKHPATLANEWMAPGKMYDQTQGVTGVAMTPGRYVIIADGIPAAKGSVELRFNQWHGHEQYSIGKDENGKDKNVSYFFQEQVFQIMNGINIIDVQSKAVDRDHRVDGDMMGLAYINNFDDEAAARGDKNPVTVHIVGGLWNGMLTATQTNAENQAVLDNAVYPIMDVVGSRMHAVFQTQALKTHAKGQYVQYVNTLDQIVMWEHRVLGLEKYDRTVENRTFTYVNYNYYMYQGGRGPTFMYDTQNRVCNPENLLRHDSDAVWGLSHEWGHQHQMAGYFCWTGMGEVTNNIFSAYNVAHMGYPIATNPGRYPRDKWQSYVNNQGVEVPGHIQKIFLNDDYNREVTGPDDKGETKTANKGDNIVMSCRSDAAKAAQAGNAFAWNEELKNFAINQPRYPAKRFASDVTYDKAEQNVVNPRTALNAIEAYSSNNGELILGPYVNLMFYFEQNGKPDLYPDFFESLRRNNQPGGGSDIEKKGHDKYELLAGIFRGNVESTYKLYELYPNSCWVKKHYVNEGGNYYWQQNSAVFIMNAIVKLSRLTGYNLWPYFERYGCFTVCAIEQGDYGTQYYIMTDDMYDEFKADMDALVANGTLKQPSDAMLHDMMYQKAPEYPVPTIPNDRPLLPSDN